MLGDPSVDIVAINTPPSSHASLSMAAMRAGKHVFCEKPLATGADDARAVLRAVEDARVAFTVNYVMRPNPLYRLLERLGRLQYGGRAVLGTLRRFSLENFASDEKLGPDHWFWNQDVSGGIFVEHGVHFFDLFGWQLGRSPLRVSALEGRRGDRGEGVIDTVQAIVEYEGGATGSFFHTFARAEAAEHQGITFGWDWATAELHGWIALSLVLDAWVERGALPVLEAALSPGARLLLVEGEEPLPDAYLVHDVVENYPEGKRMLGRGEERRITAHVRVAASLGGEASKGTAYEQCVRAGMRLFTRAVREGRVGAAPLPAADLWSSTVLAVAAREAAVARYEQLVPLGWT
jgi:predicted dehydrogenase